jgi:hypothetical protein
MVSPPAAAAVLVPQLISDSTFRNTESQRLQLVVEIILAGGVVLPSVFFSMSPVLIRYRW